MSFALVRYVVISLNCDKEVEAVLFILTSELRIRRSEDSGKE
jgi:hypothetical protein